MQFAKVNGITLHYQQIGRFVEKPTIVCSNSLGTDFRIWRDIVTGLADDYAFLLYDKRGHGLSDLGDVPYTIKTHIDDLVALMDYLKLSSSIIIGLSVGGLIAQGLFHFRPDLVNCLILCDTAAKIGTHEMWNDRIKIVEEKGLSGIVDANMERWFTDDFHANNAVELEGYKNMFTRTPARGYIGTAMAIRDADFREEAPNITVPTICIVGDQDGATSPDMVRSTAELIPSSEFKKIDGAAHIPCVEKPEELKNILRVFLSKHII